MNEETPQADLEASTVPSEPDAQPAPAETAPAAPVPEPATQADTVETPVEPTPASVPESTPPPPLAGGVIQGLLDRARAKIQERKRRKLDRILAAFVERSSLTNADVRELLHVSQSAATRYLDILEREGRIRQIGTGKRIGYELVR